MKHRRVVRVQHNAFVRPISQPGRQCLRQCEIRRLSAVNRSQYITLRTKRRVPALTGAGSAVHLYLHRASFTVILQSSQFQDRGLNRSTNAGYGIENTALDPSVTLRVPLSDVAVSTPPVTSVRASGRRIKRRAASSGRNHSAAVVDGNRGHISEIRNNIKSAPAAGWPGLVPSNSRSICFQVQARTGTF